MPPLKSLPRRRPRLRESPHKKERNMDVNIENSAWDKLTYAEKIKQLFLKQKQTLDMFLERGAISQAQHDKSLRDLIKKMEIYEKVL